jgi:hypothetical protein
MRLLLVLLCCGLLAGMAVAEEKEGWIPIGDRPPMPDPQGGCGEPIPPGELCDEFATDLGTDPAIVIEWDTSNLADDYNAGAGNTCTGYSSSGLDGAYYATISADCTVDIIYDDCPPEIEWDRSLYFVQDCLDIEGTCLCGSDNTYPGGEEGPEACAYTNGTGGPVSGYIVVDGFGGDFGPYQLTVETVCPPTATESVTWGSIKALYD